MKRMAAIILCLALIFALTACASEGKQKAQGYADVYRAIKACRSGNGARMTMYNTVIDDMAYGETAQDYSKTNTQVDGIDEGDKIKTDGKYIYYVCGNSIDIYEAAGAGSRRVGCIKSDDENEGTTCAIYLHDGVLIVVMCRFGFCVYSDAADLEGDCNRERTTVYYYDVSDPAAPKLISSAGQDGSIMTSRLYDGKLYLVTRYAVYGTVEEDEPASFVPQYYRNGAASVADSGCISIMPAVNEANYIVAGAYDAKTGVQSAQRSVLGAGDDMYMNSQSLYLSAWRFEQVISDERREGVYTVTDCADKQFTDIVRLGVSDLSEKARGSVEGYLDGQFAMDEHNGFLRVVTTSANNYCTIYRDDKYGFENYKYDEEKNKPVNGLYILDGSLNEVSSLTGLAPDETVKSVRFEGGTAYFCTFRQVDPLFAVDVSDPKAPKVLSELKISGFSEYLHPWADGRLFGLGNEADAKTGFTQNIKLVMFDTSDRADVKAKAVQVLDGVEWSDALYEHTALLISPDKNIIGFGSTDKYFIYSYTDEGGFVCNAEISFPENAEGCLRCVYAGDFAYALSDAGIRVLDMTDWSTISDVKK